MKRGSGNLRRAVVPAVLLFLFVALSPSPAAAHQPAAVILDYRAGAGALTVTIDHQVSDPTQHHIASVRIWKNGTLAKEVSYTSQPAKDGAVYTYDLPAEQGDILRVEATCNIFGSRTGETTVTAPGKAASQAPVPPR